MPCHNAKTTSHPIPPPTPTPRSGTTWPRDPGDKWLINAIRFYSLRSLLFRMESIPSGDEEISPRSPRSHSSPRAGDRDTWPGHLSAPPSPTARCSAALQPRSPRRATPRPPETKLSVPRCSLPPRPSSQGSQHATRCYPSNRCARVAAPRERDVTGRLGAALLSAPSAHHAVGVRQTLWGGVGAAALYRGGRSMHAGGGVGPTAPRPLRPPSQR